MLYDKKWDKQIETKADPFSLKSFAMWLETQPANERYSFLNVSNCAYAQYLKAKGYRFVLIGGFSFSHGWRTFIPSAGRPLTADVRHVLNGHPYTFGAALQRARTALASPATPTSINAP